MSCCKFGGNLPKGDCCLALGGLKGSIYAANICDIAGYTITTNAVTAITMGVDPLTTDPYFWYQIDFKKNTAGFNNEAAIGNNRYVNQTVTFSVEGLTTASLLVLEELLTAEVVFIVTDNRGVNHLLGRLSGLMVTEGNIGAGIAADDLYGATLTFGGGEAEVSKRVASGTTIEVSDGAGGVITVTLP